MSTINRDRSATPWLLAAGLTLAVLLGSCGGGTGSSTAEPAQSSGAEPAEDSSDAPDVIEPGLDPGIHDVTLAVSDIDRSYMLLVPSAARNAEPLPLVLAFHTWGMNPNEYVDGEWGDLAEEQGFLLAAPDGLDGEWAVAQSEAEADAAFPNSNAGLSFFPLGARDVDFAESLLDDVASQVNVDGDRIYVTGDSLGGWMASRVACELGDRLAALGPSLNSVLYSDPCATSSLVSVISVGRASDPNHSIVDARNAIESWATHNSCSFPPSEVELTGEHDLEVIEEVTFSGCTGETSVKMLAQVSGTGLDEVATLWEFFAATSRSS